MIRTYQQYESKWNQLFGTTLSAHHRTIMNGRVVHIILEKLSKGEFKDKLREYDILMKRFKLVTESEEELELLGKIYSLELSLLMSP